jgi:uncharacterized membrane protein YtjA (UPF0391 family)
MKKLPPLARNDRGAYDCARFRASGCKTYATKKSSGTDIADRRNAVNFCGRVAMLYYALVFLVVALIAGVLGFSGVAGTAANIAWILFVVGLVLALVFFIKSRSTRI